MKETVKVNISGIAFTFDSDAHQELRSYLDRLSSLYAATPDGEEVIADIEARIAELILTCQESGRVVDLKLVGKIIDQMGNPEELSSDQAGGPAPVRGKFPRRLYRDTEHGKIGGVCSGVAAWLDIDVTWVRFAVFAPLLLSMLSKTLTPFALHSMFGSLFAAVVFVYIILWVIVPAARTPREKLEMRGEKITAASIEHTLREEFTSRSDTPKSRKSAGVLAELVYVSGSLILFFVKLVAAVVALALICAVVGIIAGTVALIFGGVSFLGWTDSTVALTGSCGWSIALGALCILMPLVMLAIAIFNLLFGLKNSPRTMKILSGIWLIVLIFTVAMAVRNFDNIREFIRDNVAERHITIRTDRMLNPGQKSKITSITIPGVEINVRAHDDGKPDTLSVETHNTITDENNQ